MDLATLRIQRGQLKAASTRMKHFLVALESDRSKISQLTARFENFKKTLDQFNEIQNAIECVDVEDISADERTQFEDLYYEIVAQCNSMVEAKNSEAGSISPTSTAQIGLRLPKIELPCFEGDYTDWLNFRDLFLSLIHENEGLNHVQKLHYLKSCLKNNAAQIIASLPTIASNYSVAWQLINERFNNERILIKTHVDNILDAVPIQRESATSIRTLSDTLARNVTALKALNQPAESWSTLLVHIVGRKLDFASKRAWEMQNATAESPSFDDLQRFLRERAQFLENLQAKPAEEKVKQHRIAKSFIARNEHCGNCSKEHIIRTCDALLNKSPSERFNRIKELKLCINCLKGNHSVSNCKSSSCRKCGKRHHTLLHLPPKAEKAAALGTAQSSSDNTPINVLSCRINSPTILLSTAQVQILQSNQRRTSARALLDSGSQASFITEEFCTRLNLPTRQQEVTIVGLGNSHCNLRKSVTLHLKSLHNNYRFHVSAYVIPEITGNMPSISVCPKALQIPTHVQLADPSFYESSCIEILLGAKVFYSLLSVGQINLGRKLPTLQKTVLGWVVSGEIPSAHPNSTLSCNLSSSLEERVTKFWEIEEIPAKTILTSEEEFCEEHYAQTIRRDVNGRFVVSLPLKADPATLGESHSQALKRLQAMERKFAKNLSLKRQYVDFMEEYHKLGHMSQMEEDDTNEGSYLPHHAVVNDSSLTTKLRVVFDASARTSNGLSFNDIQACGPQIQDNLFNVVVRFRCQPFVLTADITKMYRQIEVTPKQRCLQKILWRSAPTEDVRTFRLNTITYGTKSASFLATRCLKEIANINRAKYPKASSIIESDFYVDDLLTGSDDVEDLHELKAQLEFLLAGGCFTLRKWASNVPSLLPSNEESNRDFQIHPQELCKTLGLIWNPTSDTLRCTIGEFSKISRITKRSILSTTASIFDPLGLVAPVVVVAKLIIQMLWRLKLSWDSALPLEIHTKWSTFIQQLEHLKKLSTPRHGICSSPTSLELHGFADASESAYGACIYVRSKDAAGKYSVNLLCARSRVAPLKIISIPRLELCAAVLLSGLFRTVRESIRLSCNKFTFWSDSTITLSWISSEPARWKTFVANRVAKIQKHTSPGDWMHVSSANNPADLISRGISSESLLDSELWWHGPQWLTQPDALWPTSTIDFADDPPEVRAHQQANIAVNKLNLTDFINRFSSASRLQRTFAYVLRFLHNARRKQPKLGGPISVEELEISQATLIKIVQRQHFSEEMRQIAKNGVVTAQSQLRSLKPFLDEHQMLRVGGRLANSLLPFRQRHPLILPAKGKFTTLLITAHHKKCLHAGLQVVMSSLRYEYWIISSRKAIKSVLSRCHTCFRAKPKPAQQIMADLPAERCQRSSPFTYTGVDYGGPMRIVESHRRGKAQSIRKCYIAVWVCFATKAVHLDLVSDLTTEAFLACLKRFVSRRATCKFIYSDNATNFAGATRELSKLITQAVKGIENEAVQSFITSNKITWKFIPPRSPHHGGLWEAAVKSVKFHIKRTVGETLLTYEEYSTLLCQIEGCMNSRPLTPLSADSADLNALTPFHFLIGYPVTSIPEPDLKHLSSNRLSKWQLIQRMRDHIWKRWSREYLHHLQQRYKWTVPADPVKVNDMVLLVDEQLPPMCWRLGRVVDTHAGKDSVVRIVSVKVSGGVVKRAINKLCRLPKN